MKKIALYLIAAATIFASCGGNQENKPAGLTNFDPCGCATLKDQQTEDYKKCRELRSADPAFESEFQKCLIAGGSGVDPKNITVSDMNSATNLPKASEGAYKMNFATSKVTWYGEKITGKKHNGVISVNDGYITISGGAISGFVSLDMSSLKVSDLTGESKNKLENHLKSPDFFDVGKYKNALFEIKTATAKNNLQYEINGMLTIKEITKPVTCNLVIAPNGNEVTIAGGFAFDRSEFDIRYGSDKFFDNLGDDLIKNEVILTIDLKANK